MWTFYNASGEALVQHAESEATKAEMEAETAIAHFVPPDLVKNSPGAAKAWCHILSAGTLVANSYNTASITDTGTGDRTWVFDTDMSISTGWAAVGTFATSSPGDWGISYDTRAVGSVRITIKDVDALVDREAQHVIFGKQ
tara:strand:+ start:446 stop:868 length:423 start_codon:yes stop_codon:yes gene_type:complete